MGEGVKQESVGLGKLGGSDCGKYNVRGVNFKVSHFPSIILGTSQGSHHKQREFTPLETVYSSLVKKGDNKKNKSSGKTVLFQPLRSSKGRGRVQTNYKSKTAQQVFNNSKVQNGVCSKDSHDYSGGTLGLHDGPKGCVLSSTNILAQPKISSLHSRRSNVCVSVPSLWSLSGPLGILQDNQAHKSLSSQIATKNKLLPRRFSASSTNALFVTKNDSYSTGSIQKTRPFSKSQEIRTQPLTRGGISGRNLSPKDSETFPPRGESFTDLGIKSGSSARTALFKERFGKPDRASKFCSSSRPFGASKTSSVNCLDEQSYFHRLQRSENPPEVVLQEGPQSMAGLKLPEVSSTHGSSDANNTADDRCVRDRLGRSNPSALCVGRLGRGGSPVIYKLERTKSNLSVPKEVFANSERKDSFNSFRQSDSNFLHLERRNSKISLLNGNVKDPAGICISKCNSVSTQTSPRKVKYLGRYGFQKGSYGDRMDSGQENIQVVGREEWKATSRFICKQEQQTGKKFHFPFSRQPGDRDKCLVSGLESVGQHLLVPPCEPSDQSDDLSIIIHRKGDFNSSKLSTGFVVPSTAGKIQGTLQSASVPFIVSRDIQREGVSSEPFHLSASRVETIEKALLKKNFSKGSADFINNSWKESTKGQYESIWRKFLSFLSARKIPHGSIDPAIVADFLEFNCKVLGRKYRTLATYKSSLNYPLKLARKMDMNDEDLIRFMRGAFLYRPPIKAKEMPSWSLNDLLCFLESEDFEPIDICAEEKLLQKTLFLILLASGRRIGETAKISRESFVFSRRGFPQTLTLKWVEDFTPKRFAPDFQSPCPSIQPLVSLVDGHEKLCPVRAYDAYLNRSSSWLRKLPFKERPKILWSAPKSGKALDKVFLTRVFKTLVENSRKFFKRRGKVDIGPHQARKFAASYASQVGQDEEFVRKVMGFSDVSIFRKNYVAPVPFLKMHCVLPGGTFIPES